jgi:hypothetical protein
MASIVTDQDTRTEVLAAIAPYAEDHDVDAIVDELRGAYGAVHTSEIDDYEFWQVVARHAKP